MDNPISVFIVDDETPLRLSWERLLAPEKDMTFAGAIDHADELVAHVERTRPNVVLLDLSMEGRDPLDVVGELARAFPRCRVIVYSGHRDAELMRRAFEAGAWAFVDKLDAPVDILQTIRRVAAGEVVYPRDYRP